MFKKDAAEKAAEALIEDRPIPFGLKEMEKTHDEKRDNIRKKFVLMLQTPLDMNKQKANEKGEKISNFKKEKLLRCIDVAVNLESAIFKYAQDSKDMSLY
jgi:hypothetical protein